MRLIPALALGLALVAAGCFGGDDEEGDTPTPSTPVTTTPATGGGTGGTGGNGTGGAGGNGTGGGSTTPMPKAPSEVHTDSVDFTRAPSVPPTTPAATTKPFTVPEGYTKLTLNVTWTMTGAAVVQNGVAVKVLGPDGSALLTCAGPAAGPAAPTPCTQEGPISVGGEYTAQYEGSGNVQAAVSVIAS